MCVIRYSFWEPDSPVNGQRVMNIKSIVAINIPALSTIRILKATHYKVEMEKHGTTLSG